MTPEMKDRVLATVNELIDDDFVPDIDDGPYEPTCWGFNSYEHYKGECKHFEEEELDDDDGDQDFLFEIARDKRYWDE